MVITDDRSSSTAQEIRAAAKPLEDKAIHVIAVGIGKTPDVTQLEKMTQKKSDVIPAPTNVDPAVLGNRIMEKAFRRKIFNDYIVWHMGIMQRYLCIFNNVNDRC